MQSKSLLIAIAAFAVTTTGAQAYVGNKYFNQSGLSTEQVQAFSQARDLRRKGKIDKARDVLMEAGVTEETIASLRSAAHASKNAIEEAVEAKNLVAFKEAISGTPLYDVITTEADFKLFVEAYELRREGNFIEAKEILDDLGVSGEGRHLFAGRRGKGHSHTSDLSSEQKAALTAARQANDEEIAVAILEEAGISRAKGGWQNGRFSY